MGRKELGNGDGVVKTADSIHIRIDSRLRSLVEKAAGETQTMNEVIARILATHFGKNELGTIPRKRLGRPRKEVATS